MKSVYERLRDKRDRRAEYEADYQRRREENRRRWFWATVFMAFGQIFSAVMLYLAFRH